MALAADAQVLPVAADPRLFVALDLPTRAEAEAMVQAAGRPGQFYKIGLGTAGHLRKVALSAATCAAAAAWSPTGSCTISA